jgi:uncharacterized protein YjbI with pentapeptide repeats/beta-lactamase regulating signal transducer with metallopeptidase domain
MSLPLELLAYFTRIVVAILLNSLWQGAAIAIVTWVALRLFPRANASTRYAAWCLALLAMVAVPVVTSFSTVSVQRAAVTSPVREQTTAQESSVEQGQQPVYHHTAATSARTSATTEGGASVSRPIVSMPQPLHFSIPEVAAWIVFVLWLLAAAVVLIRLFVALWQLERLKRDALPLDVQYRDEMSRWQNATKGSRDVRICVSEEINVPIAVGLFDAMVLLPSHLVDSLDPSEIDQISLHELAHLLRSDDWTNGLQRIISALFFFNPAVWFAARQMDIEREVACDDYVLELTGAVRPYAFCLTKMAEMTPWPHRAVAAPGVFVTRKNISIRIERLLRTGRAIGSSIAPSVATAVVISIAAICILLRTVTPSIAYTLPAPVQLAQAVPSPAPVHSVAPQHAPAATHKAIPAAPAHPASPSHPLPAHTAIPVATPTPILAEKPHPPARVEEQIRKEINAHVGSTGGVDVGKIVAEAMSPHGILKSLPGMPSGKSVALSNDDNSNGCTGCDYSNTNLAGKDFSDRTLTGSDFSRANLAGARFDHARLNGVDFSHANLRNASFVDAQLEGCDLRGADVTGARFDGAQMNGCDIDVSSLAPTQSRALLSNCTGCDFKDANFQGMDLRGVRLMGTNLAHANLQNANLAGAVMTGVNLSGANMNGANVDHASFTGCDFNGVDLRNVDMSKASMSGSTLRNAILR